MVIALSGMVCATGVRAQTLPAQEQSHGISYVTGGFGENMAAAFKAAEASYPLGLTFAEDAGGGPRPYVADVAVQIRRDDQLVFDVASAGPFLLVQLPPGSYVVEATYQGRKQSIRANIREGAPVHKVLTWKAP